MKWPKLRELKEAVTAVVKGPYTHPFPAGRAPRRWLFWPAGGRRSRGLVPR